MITALLRRIIPLALITAGACGGSSPPPAAPAPAAAPASASTTPFDAESVRAKLAAMAVPEACVAGDDTPTTLGALLDQNQALLGMDSTERTFTCSAPVEEGGPWSCMWAASTKPVVRSPGDDSEGEGSAFQIMVQVTADGGIVAESIGCIAAG